MLISNQFVVAESDYRREQLKGMYPKKSSRTVSRKPSSGGQFGRGLLRVRRAWST